MKKYFAFIGLALLLFSCSEPTKKKGKITIVCTTSMVADAARNLVPANVEVISLMGPGVDPHLYKATQGDLARLQNADVIIYNGLHLEGKMGDVLHKLGRIKKVIAVSDGIPKTALLNPAGDTSSHDPHIWFDLSLWAKGVSFVKNELIQIYPQWQEDINVNYFEFEQNLLATHNWAISTVQEIPKEYRVLVTAHDAFSYFGKAYDMKVMGLQGISTVSEYGLKDISEMVNFLVENKIPAVFVESSVPKKSIEAVIEGCRQRGHNVLLGGQLYSDALGDAKSDTETLIGAFRANVNTIHSGLMQGQMDENPEP